jgi:hypothetical protein
VAGEEDARRDADSRSAVTVRLSSEFPFCQSLYWLESPVMESDRWERTKQVLEDALGIEPEKRAAYLESACGNDEELRREVESLIASH